VVVKFIIKSIHIPFQDTIFIPNKLELQISTCLEYLRSGAQEQGRAELSRCEIIAMTKNSCSASLNFMPSKAPIKFFVTTLSDLSHSRLEILYSCTQRKVLLLVNQSSAYSITTRMPRHVSRGKFHPGYSRLPLNREAYGVA
jgi:hypothetical protein